MVEKERPETEEREREGRGGVDGKEAKRREGKLFARGREEASQHDSESCFLLQELCSLAELYLPPTVSLPAPLPLTGSVSLPVIHPPISNL